MQDLIERMTGTAAGFDALPLRVAAGAVFTAHGAQKLFGWFGGHGLAGTGEWMASVGLVPGQLMAGLAGGAEFFGGLLLIAGLMVRPAALALSVTMLVAVLVVHAGNGLFIADNGYEFGLVLLAISLALVVRGGGTLSADRVISRRLRLGWARSRTILT